MPATGSNTQHLLASSPTHHPISRWLSRFECLMPPPKAGAVCETCHRTIGKGPTQQFREFVEQFAPGTGPLGSERKPVQRLYEIRSKLVHGGGLLITDREQLL